MVKPPAQSAPDCLAFEAFSREQVRSRVEGAALVCLFLFSGAWIVGRIVLHGHALEGPGRFWLGVLSLVSVAAWAALRFLPVAARFPAAVTLAFHVVVAVGAASHAAQMNDLNAPFFYGVYIVPPLSVGLALRLPMRIAMTLAGPIAWVAAYFGANPGALEHEMIHVPVIILTGVISISIYLGHQLHLVVRERFMLARRLEQQQVALERHAAGLEREVEDGSRAIEHLSRVLTNTNLEREDVARALHDDLGQLIVGVRMELEVLERKLQRLSEPGEPRIQHLSTVVETLDRSVRTFIDRLREPKPVADLGESLEELVGPLRERSDLKITTAVDLHLPLDAAAREVLYRLVQEAVTNVFKHADATRIDITVLQGPDGSVVGSVRDDGRGIASDAADGLGLRGLRERAEGVQGELAVESTAEGTAVTLTLAAPTPAEELSA